MQATTDNSRADLPIMVVAAVLSGVWYVLYRTIKVITTLAPTWRRQLGYNLKMAAQIYAGHDFIIIHPEATPQIDRYHTRYEGTDRAAKDEGDR